MTMQIVYECNSYGQIYFIKKTVLDRQESERKTRSKGPRAGVAPTAAAEDAASVHGATAPPGDLLGGPGDNISATRNNSSKAEAF